MFFINMVFIRGMFPQPVQRLLKRNKDSGGILCHKMWNFSSKYNVITYIVFKEYNINRIFSGVKGLVCHSKEKSV